MIWIEDPKSIYIVSVFFKIPFQNNGFGVTGLNYQACKDFCKWSDLDQKEYVPLLLSMGEQWALGINKRKKHGDPN